MPLSFTLNTLPPQKMSADKDGIVAIQNPA